jgi:hypothetical protein
VPDLSFLDDYYIKFYRPEVKYLEDLHKEPETWDHEGLQGRRV